MDCFEHIKKGTYPFNDNEAHRKDNAWDQVPAESNFFRADKFLLKGETAKSDQITEEVESPTDCSIRQRYICLSDALKLLRNQMSERDALIFIARFYYKLKLKDLESIFRLDLTNISRVAQKAERKLKVRG